MHPQETETEASEPRPAFAPEKLPHPEILKTVPKPKTNFLVKPVGPNKMHVKADLSPKKPGSKKKKVRSLFKFADLRGGEHARPVQYGLNKSLYNLNLEFRKMPDIFTFRFSLVFKL